MVFMTAIVLFEFLEMAVKDLKYCSVVIIVLLKWLNFDTTRLSSVKEMFPIPLWTSKGFPLPAAGVAKMNAANATAIC